MEAVSRFVVRESSGYNIHPGGGPARRLVHEVMVLDSFYCYTVVWSSLTTPTSVRTQQHKVGPSGARIKRGFKKRIVTAYNWPLPKRRAYARELAQRLNQEHAQPPIRR